MLSLRKPHFAPAAALLGDQAQGGAARIPTLSEISPEYGALLERQAALNARLIAAIAELREEAKQGTISRPVPSAADAARQQRVAALLKGERIDEAAIPQPPAVPAPSSRYWALQREIEDIREFALPELDKQLRAAAAKASAVIVDRVRDAHRQLVREMAPALRLVHGLNERYWALTDELERNGIAWGALGAAFVRPIGHPADRRGPLGQWFKEAAEDGHISEGEIPEAFR